MGVQLGFLLHQIGEEAGQHHGEPDQHGAECPLVIGDFIGRDRELGRHDGDDAVEHRRDEVRARHAVPTRPGMLAS